MKLSHEKQSLFYNIFVLKQQTFVTFCIIEKSLNNILKSFAKNFSVSCKTDGNPIRNRIRNVREEFLSSIFPRAKNILKLFIIVRCNVSYYLI